MEFSTRWYSKYESHRRRCTGSGNPNCSADSRSERTCCSNVAALEVGSCTTCLVGRLHCEQGAVETCNGFERLRGMRVVAGGEIGVGVYHRCVPYDVCVKEQGVPAIE